MLLFTKHTQTLDFNYETYVWIDTVSSEKYLYITV